MQKISEAVIRRLPRYYRYLKHLDEMNVERVSSGELSSSMRLNASQIRQDFNCFGGFGQQGYGYHVKSLLGEVIKILTLQQNHPMIIAGAGNIGRALANFGSFVELGFCTEALFDLNEDLIGTTINGKPVYPLEDMQAFIREHDIEIGVIAARKSAAKELAKLMVEAGVKGIWNFAPIDVEAEVPVENMHLTDSLAVLAFRMNAIKN